MPIFTKNLALLTENEVKPKITEKMIHPHLKSNEELLSIWNGDFHDIDQMQALEQLARRRFDDFSETPQILKR